MDTESLAKFVSRVMKEKNLSGNDVQRLSGDGIHQTSVSRIRNGSLRGPSIEKLKALAKGLRVPDYELMAIAGGDSKLNLTHERLLSIDSAYASMSPKKKLRADYIIEVLEREISRISSE